MSDSAVTVVNSAWVSSIFAPMYDTGDHRFTYGRVNLNQPSSVVELVDELLKPYFLSLEPWVQARLKMSLQFAINHLEEKELEYLFNSAMPAIGAPRGTMRDFYKTIWSLMFDGETYTTADTNYIDINDSTVSAWEKGVERRYLQNLK